MARTQRPEPRRGEDERSAAAPRSERRAERGVDMALVMVVLLAQHEAALSPPQGRMKQHVAFLGEVERRS